MFKTPELLTIAHDAALRIQKGYKRTLQRPFLRSSFASMSKTLHVHNVVSLRYRNFPKSVPCMVNYALHLHTMQCQHDLALHLFEKTLLYQEKNSSEDKKYSDHLVVCQYGALLASFMQSTLHRKETLRKAVLSQHAILPAIETEGQDALLLDMETCFFKAAILLKPEVARGWCNYALFKTWVTGQFYQAEHLFLKAIALDSEDALIALVGLGLAGFICFNVFYSFCFLFLELQRV